MGGGLRDRSEDGAKALNWRSHERQHRQRDFRGTLQLHATVCLGCTHTNSPRDRVVFLLIISGPDEPSSVVPEWECVRACLRVC